MNSVLHFMILSAVINLAVPQISFDIQEEREAPVLLGNIAVEANITSIRNLDFSLLGLKEIFDIDTHSGDFKVITVLDREFLCGSAPRCVITTSVVVSSAPNFFQRYTVNVTLVDANDQRPDFGFATYTRSLSESATVNSTVLLPVASDADYEPMFKVQNYFLEPASQDTFALVVQTNNKTDRSVEFILHLRLLKKLDREQVGSYALTLVATDNAAPNHDGRLQVIISITDENDNEPVFTEPNYFKSIMEITRIGTKVLRVSASDGDAGENGRIAYEFSNDVARRVLEFFYIDRVSGGVKLVKSLEKEGGSTFRFKVKALDHGAPLKSSEVSVEIMVEDTVNDPPSISVSHWRSKGNSAVVSEDAVIGTKVAVIDVVDTDSGNNGETSCSFFSEHFSMQQYTPGEYTVSVSKGLDRERASSHTLTIRCTDRGTPPLSSTARLSVLVEDVNDNRPMFTKTIYDMNVKENQEAEKLVGSVFATDADEGINAVLRYSLDPRVTQFEINQSNGFIYTAVNNLDRETQETYTFEVYAFDTSSAPLSATATVIVNIEDVNDLWPRFDNSSYQFSISEGAEFGTVFGQVRAVDLDLGRGGMVEYLLVHSLLHPDPPFVLSQVDGTIKLFQPLDYEKEKHYRFVVTAIDLGEPPRNSSVEIHIDIVDENDNSPIISFPSPDNLSVTLNLEVSPGHEVIRVVAHDADSGENGRLSYSLSSPNSTANKLFWINEDTGLVTLAVTLTSADVRSYNIVISVNDHGQQQRATQALLQVDVVQQLAQRRTKESYTTIVIIMVCVTLFVAVIVLVTLCFIKYMDRRKYDSPKSAQKPSFEPITKTVEDYIHEGGGDDVMERGHMVSQKPPLAFQQQTSSKNGKKSVTFDSAVRSSDASLLSESVNTQADSGFNSLGSAYATASTVHNSNLLTTFNPGSTDSYNLNSSHKFLPTSSSSPHSFNTPPVAMFFPATGARTTLGHDNEPPTGGTSSSHCRGLEETEAGDEVVDVALQKHNALVRSMRGNARRPAYSSRQPRPGSASHDTDLCSSSSVETSDSGHGGSELDVSVIKVNV